MGRPPTIDRDRVLDLAEQILLKDGTGALTIDAVAKAAGVSKGGIQSRLGTKDDLIKAMLERWTGEYEAQMSAMIGPDPGPMAVARGHIEITMATDATERARAAAFMATLINSTRHRAECRSWYAELFGGLDPHSIEGRRARMALLATEGAFLLRTFGLMEFSDDEWADLQEGLRALLNGTI
ncbi:TetR/AcrR family transcriptional regulator [Pseudoroseomonas cervicalis]|uniref:Transcriptional regulator, TetR family n=1 Tax=Pseudoroseomonas cervicalis ATCC 49957 TaxID=525371 RepID=D5RQ60_9PROT|nr:TetR/AcrR family transcriptional regulator [Pseudoroseomonas cervicalis]EFH10518.1 transcriptional regulator, TetR family [Pseudoroseomonas cervicalis ATCC 49957]